MRERWWGGSGRRVPELAVRETPPVPAEEALVLVGVAELQPITRCVRGGPARRCSRCIGGGGARGACASRGGCVLVPEERRDLLELDLTD